MEQRVLFTEKELEAAFDASVKDIKDASEGAFQDSMKSIFTSEPFKDFIGRQMFMLGSVNPVAALTVSPYEIALIVFSSLMVGRKIGSAQALSELMEFSRFARPEEQRKQP